MKVIFTAKDGGKNFKLINPANLAKLKKKYPDLVVLEKTKYEFLYCFLLF